MHWFFDHAETISDRNLDRVRTLSGGIAIQHRMAYQGEYFIDRYGSQAAQLTPPIDQMLALDIPVGAGTDATRVASNPFVSRMVTGKTVGGTAMYPEQNCLDRMEALRRYTVGSAWFSNEERKKGAIVPGQLADLVVLSDDYFAIPAEQIKHLESVLTIVGGKVVYGAGDFAILSPPPLPVSPDWSPVKYCGGRLRPIGRSALSIDPRIGSQILPYWLLCPFPVCNWGKLSHSLNQAGSLSSLWGGMGCSCFAF
ncbi:MAG: amidohydrolase family protein [Microcoleaceae cyanobacterium]